MGETNSTIQQALANALTAQAEWRDEKAAEYPDDERNAEAGGALRAAAAYVLTLSDAELSGLLGTTVPRDDFAWLGEEAHRFLGTVGFGGPRDPAAVVAGLIEASRRDAWTEIEDESGD